MGQEPTFEERDKDDGMATSKSRMPIETIDVNLHSSVVSEQGAGNDKVQKVRMYKRDKTGQMQTT